MSSDESYLALRLEGPLQSWGFDSQYNRRNTGLMPTKSAIAGICCAALGFTRGNDKEKTFLTKFRTVQMTAIAIPRMETKRNCRFGGYKTTTLLEGATILMIQENVDISQCLPKMGNQD